MDTVSCARVCLSSAGVDAGGEAEALVLVVFAQETLSVSSRAVVAVVEEVERFGIVVDAGHEGFVAVEGLRITVGNWTEVVGCVWWHL